MNLIDKTIAVFSPNKALSRVKARKALEAVNAYDAARLGRNRKTGSSLTDGRTAAAMATRSLRGQARWLEENHDLADGVLNELTKRCLGKKGIQFEPMPLDQNGELLVDLQKQIQAVLKDFYRRPEVSHQFTWSQAQRLMFRSWLRDGEVLAKDHIGRIRTLNHGTKIPYSIEMLEADFLPDDNLGYGNVTQGIQTNSWGQITFYHLYDQHPGGGVSMKGMSQTRAVPANRIKHVKLVKRIGQLRGISLFDSTFTRFEDIKDIEEAERVAARISAAFAFYIKKGDASLYDENNYKPGETRHIEIAPGMGIDDLAPGEDFGSMQSNRPNNEVIPFIDSQIRRASAGTLASFSSISRNYNGTYSAQRQELVEAQEGYEILTDEFVNQLVQPVIETAIRAALAANLLDLPPDLDIDTLTDGEYTMPPMPWISPKDELNAIDIELALMLNSRANIQRRRGLNPQQVRQAIKREQELDKQDGIVVVTKNGQPPTPEPPKEEE